MKDTNLGTEASEKAPKKAQKQLDDLTNKVKDIEG